MILMMTIITIRSSTSMIILPGLNAVMSGPSTKDNNNAQDDDNNGDDDDNDDRNGDDDGDHHRQ